MYITIYKDLLEHTQSGAFLLSSLTCTGINKYSSALVCEHNLLRELACNPKYSYIKANFPIRNNKNSYDSLHNTKIYKN